MYAQLGNILFENALGFTDYSKSSEAVFAEHSLLDGSPRLQATGEALSSISISMRLHASFCKPAEKLAELHACRKDNEVLPLLWGNGKVEGNFVITTMDESIEHADSQGNVFSYLVSVTLMEYIVENKILQEKEQNKKAATAVGTNKKPTAKVKKNPSDCPQIITLIVNKILNHFAVVRKIVMEGTALTPDGKNKMRSHLKAMNYLDTDLLQRCDMQDSCTIPYPYIKTYAQKVKDTGATMYTHTYVPYFVGFETDIKYLGADCEALKRAVQPLISQATTRKP